MPRLPFRSQKKPSSSGSKKPARLLLFFVLIVLLLLGGIALQRTLSPSVTNVSPPTSTPSSSPTVQPTSPSLTARPTSKPTTPATPTPTATAPVTPTPSSNNEGRIVWRGDWETGNTDQWDVHAGGRWGDSSLEVVTDLVRQGKYAAKFTVNGGDEDSERAEVSASQENTGGYPGQEWYYSWSTYIPSEPNKTTGWAEWTDITQWMDLLYQCTPPLQIAIRPENPPRLFLVNALRDHANDCEVIGPQQEFDLGELVYDQWIDFTVRIKWSQDPAEGFVQVWRDRQQVLPLTHLRTLTTGGGVYMEQALYRAHQSGTNVLYHDATRRHTAYRS